MRPHARGQGGPGAIQDHGREDGIALETGHVRCLSSVREAPAMPEFSLPPHMAGVVPHPRMLKHPEDRTKLQGDPRSLGLSKTQGLGPFHRLAESTSVLGFLGHYRGLTCVLVWLCFPEGLLRPGGETSSN